MIQAGQGRDEHEACDLCQVLLGFRCITGNVTTRAAPLEHEKWVPHTSSARLCGSESMSLTDSSSIPSSGNPAFHLAPFLEGSAGIEPMAL